MALLTALTIIMLLICSIMIVQRIVTMKEKMSDAADVLALRIQDRLSNMQGTSLYLSSLESVNQLLVKEIPTTSEFSRFDNILSSVSGSESLIELWFHKSEKILISDYGLTDYDQYSDHDLLIDLLSQDTINECWMIRQYQHNIYNEARQMLSYIRRLPLSSLQNKGFIIVSQPLASLARAASANAEKALGDYAVWLKDDMLLASSDAVENAKDSQMAHSTVETNIRAAYWMPHSVLLQRVLPNPAIVLSLYFSAMAMCVLIARLIGRKSMAKLDRLVRDMGGDEEMDEGYEDRLDQLYQIFEGLTQELTHVRQASRDGLPLIQERLIGELLRTRVTLDEMREDLTHCGISLQEPQFAVVQASLEADQQTLLMVRKQVQAQLNDLGEVWSTYGDGSSILFLLNSKSAEKLDEKLESLCETMHDALKNFLQVDILFSIGIATDQSSTPHEAYVAARDHLSMLRMLDGQPQEPVMLAHSKQTGPTRECIQRLCCAILSQDQTALKTAFAETCRNYLITEVPMPEVMRQAEILLLRVCTALEEVNFCPSAEQLAALIRHIREQQTNAEIYAALEEWFFAQIRQESDKVEQSNQYVQDALIFIRANYMHNLSIPDIGEKIGINPIYLNRLFKSATGTTISSYLNQYRCSCACSMLKETQRTVNEISDACGFSDVRSFIRFFKKYYDDTPTEYRKKLIVQSNSI